MARERLIALIGGRSVDCRQKDRDGYGRMVAQCKVAGHNLGEAMIREGWAVEYRQFSRGAYAAAEREARSAKRGLWAGTFEPPAIGAPTPERSDRLRSPRQGPAC